MTTIYCWVNSGAGTDWQVVMAMGEDGQCLASHVSSSLWWAKRDIATEDKLARYHEAYPDGYRLEWVDNAETHKGLAAAYAKNQARAADAEKP